MYKISIPANRSYDAIQWASKTFKNNFKLELASNNWSYIFGFNDSQSATLFALKWT